MNYTTITARVETWTEELSDWCDRHPWLVVAFFSSIYVPVTVALCMSKRLWFDELFTYHISTLPTLDDIARALALSTDQQPPPFYWISRVSASLVPDIHVGLRLPEIIGVWLACVSVFWFVARRSTAMYGLIALLTLLIGEAYQYAREARPYGLVLGTTGLALICWQLAADGRKRAVTLSGVAAGIAGALSSSYYAVLVVPVFVFAEAVRTLVRRRADLPMWLAIGTGSSLAFVYLQRARRAVANFEPGGWASPERSSIFDIYRTLIGNIHLPLMAFLLVFAVGAMIDWRSSASRKPTIRAGAHEIAAIVGLVTVPCSLYLAAILVTHMITARYALAAVLGFAILVGLGAYRAARGRALAATALVLILGGSFFTSNVIRMLRAPADDADSRAIRTLLAGQPADLLVVMDDPHSCLELMFYESPDVATRLRYLVDGPASRQYGFYNYPAKGWLRLKEFVSVASEELGTFRARHHRYLLYSIDGTGFLVPKLVADGARVEAVAALPGRRLFLVTEPGAEAAPGGVGRPPPP